ncbi:MAG TPA: GNAT family N-acetyltransferase [Pseudomonadales bacterium]|nr:GNAT family N-acetyltransferase [Pseudomonadales bacterium]
MEQPDPAAASAPTPGRIRAAGPADLAAVTAIYNHYIETSAYTFDLHAFAPEARRPWFEGFRTAGRHRLLVAEGAGGDLLGYACSGPLRPKAAYDRSVETTIYLHPDARGSGLGPRLYGALLDLLAANDVHRCYAVITVPNPVSIRLHERLGFREVGRLTECGFKFDAWWDVVWMEKGLPEAPAHA